MHYLGGIFRYIFLCSPLHLGKWIQFNHNIQVRDRKISLISLGGLSPGVCALSSLARPLTNKRCREVVNGKMAMAWGYGLRAPKFNEIQQFVA